MEVSLYLRVRVNGKQQYLKPVWLNRKELKPLWGFVDGQATHCPTGAYHLRYRKAGRRVWENVGAWAGTVLSAGAEVNAGLSKRGPRDWSGLSSGTGSGSKVQSGRRKPRAMQTDEYCQVRGDVPMNLRTRSRCNAQTRTIARADPR